MVIPHPQKTLTISTPQLPFEYISGNFDYRKLFTRFYHGQYLLQFLLTYDCLMHPWHTNPFFFWNLYCRPYCDNCILCFMVHYSSSINRINQNCFHRSWCPKRRHIFVQANIAFGSLVFCRSYDSLFNQQPRCKHSSTVLGSYVAAHSTCLFHLLTQAKKRGMIVSSSQLLPISNILARRTIRWFFK